MTSPDPRGHPAPAFTSLPDAVEDLVETAGKAGEDIDAALAIAAAIGPHTPPPGAGSTRRRWATLAALGRVNLTVARAVEAHLDALAILDEVGRSAPPDTTWGVFAAEAPGVVLRAEPTDDGAALTGRKPWCSLADSLDRALVTAHVDGGRQLFEIDLHDPGVRIEPAPGWVARGLRTITSVPIDCDHVPAVPVGGVDWYLRRAGFAWGGLGVAACWYGGALGLADTLVRAARRRGGELVAMHAGAVDVALHAARAVLVEAADAVDGGAADGAAGAVLALRVRSVVADSAESVLRSVGHALGPAPLAFDAEHAARVADLELYIRQHHAERDLAALGDTVLADPS